MPITQDLLNAVEALRKYATTTQMRTPMPDDPPAPAPAHGIVPELPVSMGRLYDQWVSVILRDSREVTGALDRIVLTCDQGRMAFAHISKLTLHLQSCFESALNTRYAVHNPYGLIVTKNIADRPWFKPMARRIHRAIAMELLSIHMFRLEFALLLTRLDNITKRDLLPQEFEDKYAEHMRGLHEHFTSQRPSIEPDVLDPNFSQHISDLEALVAATDDQDIPRNVMQDDLLNNNTHAEILIRRIKSWYLDPAINTLDPNVPANVIALVGNDPAAPAGLAPGFLDFVGYAMDEGAQWTEFRPNIASSTTPNIPVSMWADATGMLQVKLRRMQETAAAAGGGVGVAGVALRNIIPDLGTLTWPLPEDFYPRAHELETTAIPNCVRYCAYEAVCTAAEAYIDPLDDELNYNTLSRSDDAFHLLMSTYTTKQVACAGFLPRWTGLEDRQWLAQLMERPTEYTSLFFTQANAIPGQFVMQRHNGIRITPRLVVHLWRRRIQEIKQNQRQLWALTHCEAPLMADVLYSMGPIVLANRKLRVDGAFPAEELAILIKRLWYRFEPSLCFDTIRDNTIPAAEIPFWNTAAANFRVLREPDSREGDTTQPMSEDERTWMAAVRDVFQAAWTGGGGGAPAAHIPATTRWAPLIMNATRHASYDEKPLLPAARPTAAAQSDLFETHNVVCRVEPLASMWQFIYRILPRINVIERNVLLSSFSFNSMTISHLMPALEAMTKIQNAIQGFPLLQSDNDNGQHVFGIEVYNGGFAAMARDPATGEPVRTDLQRETGYISQVTQSAIASHFAAVGVIPVRFPSVMQLLTQTKTRFTEIQAEYKARRAPFTAPRFRLTMDPVGLPGIAPPWIRVDPRRDVVNGVIIELPVAVGAVPAPLALDVAHAAIIVDHHAQAF